MYNYTGNDPILNMESIKLIEGHGGRKVKVIEGIGPHWEDVARALKIEQEVIDSIKSTHPSHSHHEACSAAVLASWLQGDGAEVSWTSLVQGIITAGLPELADSLKEILKL